MFRRVSTGLDGFWRVSTGCTNMDTPRMFVDVTGLTPGGEEILKVRTRSMLSVFIDFFDNNNTVEKHLFFLIQSILLFHDRCCFTFFSARPIYVRLQ